MRTLREYVRGINRDSNYFAAMIHENEAGVPFDISFRFTRTACNSDLYKEEKWNEFTNLVETRSKKTMFVRSTPWEYTNGIIEYGINPKNHDFKEERIIDTLEETIKFFKEIIKDPLV